MKKICQPSPPMRRQRTLKRPAAQQTSKLEAKLDGLVSLLKSATHGPSGIINAPLGNSALDDLVAASQESTPGPTASSRVGYREYMHSRPSPNESGFTEHINTPATSSASKQTPPNSFNLQLMLNPALEPSPEDAESYLNRFRTDCVKHFPFIIISPLVTAHQLRQDRPLLWNSIMTVASSNSTQQISLSKEMRGTLAREAFIEGTRSMDLLLAILVYAAW
jgi:hypothetical protein